MKKYSILLCILLNIQISNAQVKIGGTSTAPHPSAVLELSGTNKGMLPPRLTLAQRDSIVSPAEGLLVYCTNSVPKSLYMFNGNQWVPISSTTINGGIVGSKIGDMQYWNGTSWQIVAAGEHKQSLNFCNGKPTWGNCPLILPTAAKTVSVTNIKRRAADINIKITNNTNIPLIDVGIIISAVPILDPSLGGGFKIYGSKDTGVQTILITELSRILKANTTYYVRAFAQNVDGTTYGEEINFHTLNPPFPIGTTGPAGGIIFYDKGFYSEGWRFLEAAPNDIVNTGGNANALKWGCMGTNIIGTSSLIGSGNNNTNLIYAGNCMSTDDAAYRCINYVHNGFTDWFMPSYYEMAMMDYELYLDNLGGLIGGIYMTSTQVDASSYYTWLTIHHNHSIATKNEQINNKNVRPIRAY